MTVFYNKVIKKSNLISFIIKKYELKLVNIFIGIIVLNLLILSKLGICEKKHGFL